MEKELDKSVQKPKERADKERNRELIREKMLEYIAEHGKMPTYTKLAELTGIHLNNVIKHVKSAKFKPLNNPLRVLTNDVLLSIHKRAVGFNYVEETFEKLDNKENLEVTTAGELMIGDTYKKKIVTKTVLPDPVAQKLFMQIMEGWSEKTKTEVSGNLGFTFNYVAPEPDGN